MHVWRLWPHGRFEYAGVCEECQVHAWGRRWDHVNGVCIDFLWDGVCDGRTAREKETERQGAWSERSLSTSFAALLLVLGCLHARCG